jgi:hypothetical protein
MLSQKLKSNLAGPLKGDLPDWLVAEGLQEAPPEFIPF